MLPLLSEHRPPSSLAFRALSSNFCANPAIRGCSDAWLVCLSSPSAGKNSSTTAAPSSADSSKAPFARPALAASSNAAWSIPELRRSSLSALAAATACARLMPARVTRST